MGYTINVLERLAKKFVIADSGCWDWQGAMSLGYGTVTVDYKQTTAHRHLYQAIFGLLPRNLDLDHLCRNRACVNPEHLEPVTRKENILRGEGIAAKNKAKTSCKNGHEFNGINTYIRLRNGVQERDCRACHKDAMKRFLLKKGKFSWEN